MLKNLVLNKFTGNVFKKKVKNDPRKCIRNNNEKDKCIKCIDTCPEEAISTTEDGVYVDPILCTGCNLCVSICYSRNFSSDKMPYLKLSQALTQEACVTLTCIKDPRSDAINMGCLRALDERYIGAYMASGLEGQIELNLSKCEGCPYKDLSDLKFFEDLNDKYPDSKAGLAISKEDLEEEASSRREFLASLAKGLGGVKEATIKDLVEGLESFGLAKTEIENVDIFINLFLQRAMDNEIDLGPLKDTIYQVKVNQACTMCLECINACPKSCLSYSQDDSNISLWIDLEACNFCGRCIEKCSFGAIEKSDLKNLGKVQIHNKVKYKCKACKIRTSELDENQLCPACSIRHNKRNKFKLS